MQSLFRELTAAEIDLVAGSQTIVVTGFRLGYGSSSFGGGWGGAGGGGGSNGGYSTQDYSGGGEIQYPPAPATPCDLDAAKDGAARTIEDLIRQQPDWNSREYGALILRDSAGYIHVGDLVRGETVAEAEARAIAANDPDYAPRIDFPSPPAGYTVVGVVHSHPDLGYTATEDARNRAPSADDYANFSALVGIDSRFSSQANFTQYIFGPDGVLREFDWTDGQIVSLTDAEAAARANLEADRPCA